MWQGARVCCSRHGLAPGKAGCSCRTVMRANGAARCMRESAALCCTIRACMRPRGYVALSIGTGVRSVGPGSAGPVLVTSVSQVRGARRLLARPPALATQKPTVALPGAFHRHPPHPQPRSRSSRSSPAPAPARRPTEASAARRDPWARADADWTPREEPPDEGQHAPTAPRNAPSARRHREQPAEQAGLGRGYSNAPARCSPSGPAAGEQCSIGSPGTQPGWSCYRPHAIGVSPRMLVSVHVCMCVYVSVAQP